MATLYKRNGADIYTMRFAHAGKTYRESTGVCNKQEAEKIMRQRIKDVQSGGNVHTQFKRMLATLEAMSLKEQDELRREFTAKLRSVASLKLPLAEAFDEYKAKPRKHDPSPRTLKQYEGDWTRFTDWLGDNYPQIEFMHEVEPIHATRYLTARWKQKITSRTYNKDLTLYRGIFTALKLEAGLDSNPFDGIEKKRLTTTGKQMLEPAQIEILLGKADDEMRVLILIGLYTGMRLGDACTLKTAELDLKAGTITRITRKTDTQVVVPLHEVLKAILTALPKEGEYLLPRMADLYQRNASNVSRMVQDLFEAAKIDTHAKRRDGRGKKATTVLGFHSLRHSFISLCHASNVPAIAIRDMVGHSSEAVHRIYQHTNEAQKKRAIAALPDVLNGGRE